MEETEPRKAAGLALRFWETVAGSISEWGRVRRGELSAGEVRNDFIHTHSVVLQAIARAGSALIKRYPKQWQTKLVAIKDIDWRRSNANLWEGRAILGGRVSKAHQNVTLTANAIKGHLGLALSPGERLVEDAFNRRDNGSKQR